MTGSPKARAVLAMADYLRRETVAVQAYTAAQVLVEVGPELFLTLIDSELLEVADDWEPAAPRILDGLVRLFRARGSRVHPHPAPEELAAECGGEVEGEIASFAWPLAAFLAAGHSSVDDPSGMPQTSHKGIGAAALVLPILQRDPTFFFSETLKRAARAEAKRRNLNGREREDLEQDLEQRLVTRIAPRLNNTFDPRKGSPVRYAEKAIRRAAGDEAESLTRERRQRTDAGDDGVIIRDHPVGSTLRRYRRRVDFADRSTESILAENLVRQRHQDPTGNTLTYSQLARRHEIPESTVRKAARTIARDWGEEIPRDGSPRGAARLNERWQKEILARAPRRRGSRTVAEIASEQRCGVPDVLLALSQTAGVDHSSQGLEASDRLIDAGRIVDVKNFLGATRVRSRERRKGCRSKLLQRQRGNVICALKLAILRSGKPQYSVAAQASLTESRLCRIVRGRVLPSEQERRAIAAALGRDVSELFPAAAEAGPEQ